MASHPQPLGHERVQLQNERGRGIGRVRNAGPQRGARHGERRGRARHHVSDGPHGAEVLTMRQRTEDGRQCEGAAQQRGGEGPQIGS